MDAIAFETFRKLIDRLPYKFRIGVSDRMKSNMSLKYHKDVSFSVAVFYLKIVGLWLSTSLAEKWFRNALVTYTVLAIIFNMWMQLRGLYFSWGDFSVSTYIACNSLGLFMDLFKLLIIFIHKKKFLDLVVYMQKNFWHFNYNQYEKSVLADAKRMCIYFVCVFSFLSQSTIFSYIFMPLISNIGKNKSDRVPIFHMHLDLPLNVSPYYEMTYLIQALTLYQVGVCYLCVDNIFCIMCLHVASQFRILQYRIANVLSLRDKIKFDQDTNLDSSDEFYAIFRKCIQQHQALIRFCTTLEEIFTVIILGQVLTFSILICFVGYQALLVKLSLSWRISLVSFLTTNICQLWIFTYSCNALVEESMNTANAAYAAPWIYLPMDKFGEMTRKDLQLVLMRSRRACYLTACGFFPISLETFTKIMSSAMSYFTILKQRTVDTIE